MHNLRRKGIVLVVSMLICVVSRLIPHPANMTPLVAMIIINQTFFNRVTGVITCFVAMLAGDVSLALTAGYPILGSWSLFTYTGIMAICLFMPKKLLNTSPLFLISTIGVVHFLYWLWTNWGVWVASGMYTHSLQGLVTCYIAAIPFLRNSIVGTFFYLVVFQLGLWTLMVKWTSTINHR